MSVTTARHSCQPRAIFSRHGSPVDISGTVVGYSPDGLLLSGTVVHVGEIRTMSAGRLFYQVSKYIFYESEVIYLMARPYKSYLLKIKAVLQYKVFTKGILNNAQVDTSTYMYTFTQIQVQFMVFHKNEKIQECSIVVFAPQLTHDITCLGTTLSSR